jgi:hypothetical protein
MAHCASTERKDGGQEKPLENLRAAILKKSVGELTNAKGRNHGLMLMAK